MTPNQEENNGILLAIITLVITGVAAIPIFLAITNGDQKTTAQQYYQCQYSNSDVPTHLYGEEKVLDSKPECSSYSTRIYIYKHTGKVRLDGKLSCSIDKDKGELKCPDQNP